MLVHLVVVVPACKGFLAPSQKCYYNCKKVCWRVLYKVSSWNFRVSGLSFQLENPLEFDFRFRKSSKPNLGKSTAGKSTAGKDVEFTVYQSSNCSANLHLDCYWYCILS